MNFNKHEYEIVFESGYRIRKDLEENLDDIIKYLFHQKYDKDYDELNWFLEENARSFVKDVEDKWLANKLDTSEMYKDNYIYRLHAEDVALDLYFNKGGYYDEEDDEYYYDDFDVADVIVLG